jgi:putative transposase
MRSAPPIRKNMKRREIPRGIRFVTFSCERRLPLLGHRAIRDVFAAALAEAKQKFEFSLFAWVVMPENVHLLLLPRGEFPLDRILGCVKKSVAQRVIARWKALQAPVLSAIARPDGSPRFWQKGGGFDRNVRDKQEFVKEIRYIHRNPVTRGLVERPEDWRWSSARWWMGQPSLVECDRPEGGRMEWGNTKWFV